MIAEKYHNQIVVVLTLKLFLVTVKISSVKLRLLPPLYLSFERAVGAVFVFPSFLNFYNIRKLCCES